jgi:hypothetical protein
MNTVRKFRLFWAWQDEQEEQWLRQMSAQGLHMQRVVFPGFYDFAEGEPTDYVYCLDFKSSTQKDMQDYLQIFRDAGWDYLGRFSNWQYFRKAFQPGEAMDIYSDVDSKIEKYRRLIAFLTAFLPLIIVTMINVSKHQLPVMPFLMFAVLVLYIVAFLKLAQRIRKLKNRE